MRIEKRATQGFYSLGCPKFFNFNFFYLVCLDDTSKCLLLLQVLWVIQLARFFHADFQVSVCLNSIELALVIRGLTGGRTELPFEGTAMLLLRN